MLGSQVRCSPRRRTKGAINAQESSLFRVSFRLRRHSTGISNLGGQHSRARMEPTRKRVDPHNDRNRAGMLEWIIRKSPSTEMRHQSGKSEFELSVNMLLRVFPLMAIRSLACAAQVALSARQLARARGRLSQPLRHTHHPPRSLGRVASRNFSMCDLSFAIASILGGFDGVLYIRSPLAR